MKETLVDNKPTAVATTKTRAWLLPAVGFLALVAGIFLASVVFPDSASRLLGSSDQKYSNPKEHFSLTYPKQWKPLEPQELSQFKNAFAFAIRRQKPAALVSIQIQRGRTKDIDFSAIAEQLDKNMPKAFAGFEKEAHEPVSLRTGQQALIYKYSFTTPAGAKSAEQLVIVPLKDRVLQMTVWSAAKDFNKIKSEISRIVDGFSII